MTNRRQPEPDAAHAAEAICNKFRELEERVVTLEHKLSDLEAKHQQ